MGRPAVAQLWQDHTTASRALNWPTSSGPRRGWVSYPCTGSVFYRNVQRCAWASQQAWPTVINHKLLNMCFCHFSHASFCSHQCDKIFFFLCLWIWKQELYFLIRNPKPAQACRSLWSFSWLWTTLRYRNATLELFLKNSSPSGKLTFVLFLQYKRHGSGTKSRILGAINHINKVKLKADILKSSHPGGLLIASSSAYSCIGLSTFESCWWAWRSGPTKTTLTLTATPRPPWTGSCCGGGLSSCSGWNMTMPSLWRKDLAGCRFKPGNPAALIWRLTFSWAAAQTSTVTRLD